MPCRLRSLGLEVELSGAALRLLELDANYSVYGERLAGLLLPPFEAECGGREGERLRQATRAYRRRVAAEQFYELAVKSGPLAGEVEVRPSYAPVSRMALLSRLHGCRFEALLSQPGAAGALDREYAQHARGLTEDSGGGWLRLRPPALREAIRGLMASFRGLGASAAAAAPLPHWAPRPCRPTDPPPLLREPWRLARLPEGEVIPHSTPAAELAGRVLGARAECRVAGSRAASTLLCESPRGRVAVKEYYRMALKWIPAAAISAAYIRYRVTPKSRLAGEYRYLRLLRPVAGTPRVLAVSVDYNHASMAREFVEGEPVLDSEDPGAWRLAGQALARIHRAGYVVGDPNPGNFIVSGGEARLIDAEQARGYSVKAAAWDLAVFSAYARVTGVPLDLIGEALEAYREGVGDAWGPVARVFASRSLWLSLSIAPRTALELHRLASRLAGG